MPPSSSTSASGVGSMSAVKLLLAAVLILSPVLILLERSMFTLSARVATTASSSASRWGFESVNLDNARADGSGGPRSPTFATKPAGSSSSASGSTRGDHARVPGEFSSTGRSKKVPGGRAGVGAGASGSQPGRTHVFLHSHGRSGSTIAEALLFSTTNVFYLDEPLKELRPVKGKTRVDLVMDLLRDCEFPHERNTQNRDLYGREILRLCRENPVARAPWTMTIKNAKCESKTRVEIEDVNIVAEQFAEYCRDANVSAAKVIRLAASGTSASNRGYDDESIEYLLRAYESAKVIHLVRHPYEVLHSRTAMEWKTDRGMLDNICKSTKRDLDASTAANWGDAGR